MSNTEPMQRLRHEVADFLKGKTDAGDNVFRATTDIEEDKLPFLNIFTPSEIKAGELLIIKLDVYISTTGSVKEDLLDNLDPLVFQVKQQLNDFDMASLMESLEYIGRDNSIDDSGKSLIATAQLTFEASVFNEY